MLTPSELEVVWLSVRVAALAVLGSLAPGVAIALLLARWHSPWRTLVQGVVMLPLVMPPVVTGYLLLELLGRSSTVGQAWHALTGGHVAYTTSACVIAAAVVGFPLLVEGIRLSIVGIDQRLELVSRSLGRGRTGTFFRVTLPLAMPGVIGGAVLGFARALGEFGATIVLAGNIEGETRQIPLAVFTLLNVPGSESAVIRLTAISVGLSLAALVAATWLANAQRRRAGSA
jgi:molybdate transport system permease protein